MKEGYFMEKLPTDKKIGLSDLRFERAMEMIEDARKSLAAGMIKTSINRSYYATLHATRSLLILKGLDPVTHDGAIKLLSLDFIKSGLLPQEMVKIIKRLLSMRTDVDYGDLSTYDRVDAEEALKDAEEFLGEIDFLRKRLIEEINK